MALYYKIAMLICAGQVFLLALVINNSLMKRTGFPLILNQEILELPLGITVFFFNILVIFAVKNLYFSSKEAEQNKIDRLKMEQLEKQYELHRQHKHDFKNHLNVIAGLARKNDHERLLDYLSNYINHLEKDIPAFKTGLKEMDILLYAKSAEAHSKGVEFEHSLFANLHCSKKDIPALISMVSNLVDNAITAASKNKPPNNKVKICIHEDPVDYIFIIGNQVSPKQLPLLEQSLQKEETESAPGKGLLIVKRMARKYNANLEFNLDENYFEVLLEIPKHCIVDEAV